MSTHPKSVAIGNLGGGGSGGGSSLGDWTGVTGVIGRGTDTPFSAGDYTDAFAISRTGPALTSIATLDGGNVLRAVFDGAYGGLRFENVGAVDCMVAARLCIVDNRTAALGDAALGNTILAGLALTSNQTTLAPYECAGVGQLGVNLISSKLSYTWSPAAWATWNLRSSFTMPLVGEFDIAFSQISGVFRWWIGINGAWRTVDSAARASAAGAVMVRLVGTAGRPFAVDVVDYAPVGTFAASDTMPPSLAVDP